MTFICYQGQVFINQKVSCESECILVDSSKMIFFSKSDISELVFMCMYKTEQTILLLGSHLKSNWVQMLQTTCHYQLFLKTTTKKNKTWSRFIRI